MSFELATAVFNDSFAIEWLDPRMDYSGERFLTIGMADGAILLYVAYTERHDRIRIISARKVTQNEQDEYFQQNS